MAPSHDEWAGPVKVSCDWSAAGRDTDLSLVRSWTRTTWRPSRRCTAPRARRGRRLATPHWAGGRGPTTAAGRSGLGYRGRVLEVPEVPEVLAEYPPLDLRLRTEEAGRSSEEEDLSSGPRVLSSSSLHLCLEVRRVPGCRPPCWAAPRPRPPASRRAEDDLPPSLRQIEMRRPRSSPPTRTPSSRTTSTSSATPVTTASSATPASTPSSP